MPYQARGSAKALLTWLAWLPVVLSPWLSWSTAPDPVPVAACVRGTRDCHGNKRASEASAGSVAE